MADAGCHNKGLSEVLQLQMFKTETYITIDQLVAFAATDWQFAFTREGKNVPFGTAGDCYSATRCPQVRVKENSCSNDFITGKV